MGKNNFLKLSESFEEFESKTESQKASTDRYIELLSMFEEDMDKPKEMEFFYYSKTRENAVRLKKDLEKIGFTVYGIEKSTENQFLIIGVTPPFVIERNELKPGLIL